MTDYYSPEAHCPRHIWIKKDEDNNFEYYECSNCGATDSRGKI